MSNKSRFRFSFLKFPGNVKYVATGKYYNILFFLTGAASIEVCGNNKVRICGGEAFFLPANSQWTLLSKSPCQISSFEFNIIDDSIYCEYWDSLFSGFRSIKKTKVLKLKMCEALTELSGRIKDSVLNKDKRTIIEGNECFEILKENYSPDVITHFLYSYLLILEEANDKKVL